MLLVFSSVKVYLSGDNIFLRTVLLLLLCFSAHMIWLMYIRLINAQQMSVCGKSYYFIAQGHLIQSVLERLGVLNS